jgi:RsiW-degrading membrane proteinase PrsW (M82 family)
MIFPLILLGCLFIVNIWYNFYLNNKYNANGELVMLWLCGSIFALLLTSIAFTYSIQSIPQAIDVYRGNTELEIHYINNIPQDTVVVWKGGIEK